MKGLTLVLLLLAASPAAAAVTDYLGKPIAEVHVRLNGVDLRDPSLLEIVETRRGTPLAMDEVRETVAHLFGLGRYQDVQVDATSRADGVVLAYNVTPAQRVLRIAFEGPLALPEDELRRVVVDRYGPSPPLARSPEAAKTIETLYRDRGYPRAQVTVRSEPQREPGSALLVFQIDPGVRARIHAIDVQGATGSAAADLLSKTDLRVGSGYDGVALDGKLIRYADAARAQGFYEARAVQQPRFVNDNREVDLELIVDMGPHVEIAFAGDALSARDRGLLVPIAREHSVDEDLLEDSKFAIERYFRAGGFCTPRVDYQRSLADGVLRIVFTLSKGPQCMLERADISGNASIPTADLSPLVQAKTAQPFIESTVDDDAARIQALYRQRGFAGVKVTPQIERGETREGVAQIWARFDIVEGSRSLIESISFDGNSAFSSDALLQAMTLRPGQPYVEPQVSADADTIAVLYLNSGYQEVTIQPQPTLAADNASVNLRFAIHEGGQVLVDHILIVGHQRTRTDTIARVVKFKSGQPLSQRDEDETRASITALGLFRRVDISYLQLPGAQAHRDVVIRVEEAPVTSIGYGGGFVGAKRLERGSATGDAVEVFHLAPRGFFEVGRRNLFGKDRSLNLFTRVSFTSPAANADATASDPAVAGGYGPNEYLVRLAYGERRVFGTALDATLAGGVEQASRSSFDFNRRSLNATLARRLRTTLAISGRYALDHTRLFNVRQTADKPLIDRLFPQVRLSAFSGSLLRDTRDDALEPKSGELIGLDADIAARRIGSEVGFFKTFLQGFTYRRVGRGGVIAALGGRLGLATGFPRPVTTTNENGETITTVIDDLPASERFYAGGNTTVRGFTLDRLGTPATIDADGFPKGGHGLVIFNSELRIPVRGSIGAVLFADAGNVFLHVDDLDLRELRGSVGVGLRYRSPVGPIRVDLGFKTDRRRLPKGDLERPTALHISLGQAF